LAFLVEVLAEPVFDEGSPLVIERCCDVCDLADECHQPGGFRYWLKYLGDPHLGELFGTD